MEELVQLVSQKTGLSQDHAKVAVQTVVGFLKDKLPAPIASQIDSVIQGGAGGLSGALGQAGNMAQGLGGLFGKK